jgi:hypothetical protein
MLQIQQCVHWGEEGDVIVILLKCPQKAGPTGYLNYMTDVSGPQ